MYKYHEFLVEKLILESQLSFSKSFYKVINDINTDTSKKLLSLVSKDIEPLQYNYIDISKDENDSVSFITDRKAKEIIGDRIILYKVINSGKCLTRSSRNSNIYNRLNFEIPADSVYTPSIGVIGKIIGETHGSTNKIYCLFEAEGNKTIINKDALELSDENDIKLWTTNRNPIKIGRLVRALFRSGNITTTDREIELFVNKYKSAIDIINDAFLKFDIVEGDEISRLYDVDNYESDNGSLGSSCMCEVPRSYFEIYVDNPSVCRMVVLYTDDGQITNGKYTSDKICGRAILWTTVEGDIFMDRIYTNDDSDVDIFKKFADKNGWWHKCVQEIRSNFTAERDGQTKSPVYTVQLNVNNSPDIFPYLDTVCYYSTESRKLSNNSESISANILLNDTEGSWTSLD